MEHTVHDHFGRLARTSSSLEPTGEQGAAVDDVCSTMQHARVRIGGHTRIAEGPKSTRPSRGSRVDYAQKMQEMQRASPGTASAKAEVALESLKNGESTSQTKAAAAVGVHESTLSLLKRQSAAPYAKFNRSGTRLVELPMGVTYVEEVSFGPGGTTPGAAKARGLRTNVASPAFRGAGK